VDVGFKYIGGHRTEEVAIRIFVRKKQDVPGADAIPSVIEGVKTDVIEQSEFVPLVLRVPADAIPSARAPEHVDTLVGGLSLGPCRAIDGGYYAGTLGVIVTKGDNEYYALSNFHVLCVDNAWKGGDIAQPGRPDNGACPYDTIGEAVAGCYGNYIACSGKWVDAAICTITGRGFSNQIKNIGLVEGSAVPMLGAPVRKQGRTTGLTYGFIDGLGGSNYVDNALLHERIYFHNNLHIRPDPSKNAKFSDHGDSGSAVVDEENQVVGLLWGGATDTEASLASNFQDVELALGIRLYTDLPPGPYFLLHKERDQSVQIYNYYIDGVTPMWKGHWASGWTITRSFTFEDEYCIFSYKNDGTVAMARINSNVQGTSEQWRSRWSTGWTIIEPFELGDNTYLFSCKSGDSAFALDQINPGLQNTTELYHGRLNGGYTTIIKPFIIGDYAFLFEYQPGDGRVRISQFYPGFTKGITTLWGEKWTLDYTAFEPFYMKGNVYLFKYKSGTGYAAIDRIDTNPFGTTNVWTNTWSTGWTIIESFYIDDAVYLVKYNERHGTVAFHWIDPASMRPTERYRGTWVTELTNIQHCFHVNP
jgi:hypothetical protein